MQSTISSQLLSLDQHMLRILYVLALLNSISQVSLLGNFSCVLQRLFSKAALECHFGYSQHSICHPSHHFRRQQSEVPFESSGEVGFWHSCDSSMIRGFQRDLLISFSYKMPRISDDHFEKTSSANTAVQALSAFLEFLYKGTFSVKKATKTSRFGGFTQIVTGGVT